MDESKVGKLAHRLADALAEHCADVCDIEQMQAIGAFTTGALRAIFGDDVAPAAMQAFASMVLDRAAELLRETPVGA